ncbi:entry exclusion lipoprotein TrbK [Paraburkholderia tropica]|uniref:entry exclusion lipoprotein TrbK n=1 Tax=Paraburkholderia tropica TaxID=92647 RepID=UPI002AB5E9E6|nr:entry exclusion lipoprotein TrbK [Paraburkholderia tropica]
MRMMLPFFLAMALVACGKSEHTATGPAFGSTETVDSLVANSERLKDLRQQCATDRARLGDELCNRVAEATNRRFLGDGKVPYNPPKEAPKF